MHYQQVIKLNPLLPWGYELKHVALHKAGDYNNTISAFKEMLLKMEQSPDPDIHCEFVLMVTVRTIIY